MWRGSGSFDQLAMALLHPRIPLGLHAADTVVMRLAAGLVPAVGARLVVAPRLLLRRRGAAGDEQAESQPQNGPAKTVGHVRSAPPLLQTHTRQLR